MMDKHRPEYLTAEPAFEDTSSEISKRAKERHEGRVNLKAENAALQARIQELEAIYLSAVKGRGDFRNAHRRGRARITELEAENSKLMESMCSVIEAITAHLPPHGIPAKKCLSRIIAAIDNPEINAVLLKHSPPAPVNGESEELRAALKGALGWVRHWQADVAGNLKPTMESLLIAEQAINAALSKREGK